MKNDGKFPMTKRESLRRRSGDTAGRFVWRGEDGKMRGIDIARPSKRPSSASIAEIRRAVRSTDGSIKKK